MHTLARTFGVAIATLLLWTGPARADDVPLSISLTSPDASLHAPMTLEFQTPAAIGGDERYEWAVLVRSRVPGAAPDCDFGALGIVRGPLPAGARQRFELRPAAVGWCPGAYTARVIRVRPVDGTRTVQRYTTQPVIVLGLGPFPLPAPASAPAGLTPAATTLDLQLTSSPGPVTPQTSFLAQFHAPHNASFAVGGAGGVPSVDVGPIDGWGLGYAFDFMRDGSPMANCSQGLMGATGNWYSGALAPEFISLQVGDVVPILLSPSPAWCPGSRTLRFALSRPAENRKLIQYAPTPTVEIPGEQPPPAPTPIVDARIVKVTAQGRRVHLRFPNRPRGVGRTYRVKLRARGVRSGKLRGRRLVLTMLRKQARAAGGRSVTRYHRLRRGVWLLEPLNSSVRPQIQPFRLRVR